MGLQVKVRQFLRLWALLLSIKKAHDEASWGSAIINFLNIASFLHNFLLEAVGMAYIHIVDEKVSR